MRSRILASILLVAGLGLGIAGAVTFLVQRDRTLHSVDDRLLSRVDAARFVVAGDGARYATSSAALQAVIARIVPSGNESALGVVEGAAAFVPGVALDFRLDRVPGLVTRVSRETADGSIRLGTVSSTAGIYRYIAIPVAVSGDSSRAIYVVAVDLDRELTQLSAAFTTYAIVAVIALAAIGAVGWFVAGRLLRPIRELRVTASRITANDRGERIPVRGRDDVSELTATINDMLDRLDGALTGQRQLLEDVRHELRTPITIVRGHLEVVDPANPDEVAAARALAIDELDRMSGLVDDIEALAGAAAVVLAPVDVAELTSDVYEKLRVVSGHDWALAQVASGVVLADAARITQAWLQLADNAAKYSPAGSPIEIGSSAAAGGVELWVRDHGPGVPEEARVRIFERFGRAEAGRGIRGSGLGLAIVSAIVSEHGGRVALESDSNGSRFGIVLPGEGYHAGGDE